MMNHMFSITLLLLTVVKEFTVRRSKIHPVDNHSSALRCQSVRLSSSSLLPELCHVFVDCQLLIVVVNYNDSLVY